MMFETYKFLCLGKSTFYTVTYKLCNILKSSFFFSESNNVIYLVFKFMYIDFIFL